jgi:hypothetical protein
MDHFDSLYDKSTSSKVKIFKFIPMESLREDISSYTD